VRTIWTITFHVTHITHTSPPLDSHAHCGTLPRVFTGVGARERPSSACSLIQEFRARRAAKPGPPARTRRSSAQVCEATRPRRGSFHRRFGHRATRRAVSG
jgi:hypothetical protein